MTRLAMISFFSALLAAGCGGDDDGGLACGTAACGGDPVGTWTIANTCATFGDFVIPGCPDATRSDPEFDLSGSVTFNDDGSYNVNVTSAVAFNLTIPGTCLAGTGISQCSELEDGDPDVSCTGTVDTECACAIDSNETSTDTGTWTATGDQIDLDGDGAADFCVSGSSMSLHFPSDGNDEIELILVR